MNLKNKNVLIMGLGISGIATIKVLEKLGAKISINDAKNEEELKDILEKVKAIDLTKFLGSSDMDLSQIDIIVKSPGIPPANRILLEAREKNIKIINDIEIGSEFSKSKNIIAITGTNGKTTSTTLVGEILKRDKKEVSIGGNIGTSIIEKMLNGEEDHIFVLETSSFQLEDTLNFKPKISLILNITPDHLDWHGSFENYIGSKKKIFKNQNLDDYTILNYDDPLVHGFESEINSNLIYFSVNNKLDRGVYLEEKNIVANLDGKKIKILPLNQLLLKGSHNLENILASVAIALLMRVDLEIIKGVLREFKGVEHRLEFVKEKNGRNFYNDSKATNIDSTIKAIKAIEAPIILIAGGYDKKIKFEELIKVFKGKVKTMILLGETSLKIDKAAKEYGFDKSFLVNSMEEAVELAYNLSEKADNILLSPACASWGMFKNFEERGKAFKQAVDRLKEE